MNQRNASLKILFVARNYPPIIGGLENNAFNFNKHMAAIAETDLLANPDGKNHLVRFFFKTVFFLIFNSRHYNIIHFNDAVLAPVLPITRIFSKAKITFTVNGLDVVYDNPLYQSVIPFFLRRADQLFPISRYTKLECEKRGIEPGKLHIITVGINLTDQPLTESKDAVNFLETYSIDGRKKKILVSIGRLVERKGHAWFLDEVFPQLPEDYIYILAGDGPQRQMISNIIAERGWSERVHLVGRITDDEKYAMYQCADLFIMPNISVRNDPEGFGIVILEAGCYNLPVVATDIEGISSAVLDGVTGRLIPERDVRGFVDAIVNINVDRTRIRSVVEERFNWNRIADQYLQVFLKITNKTN